jgi:diaminopimelate decarboxylase
MSNQETIDKILGEVKELDFSERIHLVESIIHSLRVEEEYENKKKKKGEENKLASLFGIWKDRDVSLDSIRDKAWRRQ